MYIFVLSQTVVPLPWPAIVGGGVVKYNMVVGGGVEYYNYVVGGYVVEVQFSGRWRCGRSTIW